MKTIKVYCNADEKERIQAIANTEDLTTSKYLLKRGLSDLPKRAMLAQLVSYMAPLIESEAIRSSLLDIAQEVLEGSSIQEARAQIAEVCKDANQGNQRQ